MQSNKIQDWEFESYESIASRLDATKQSQSRTRTSLIIIMIITFMMFLSVYNSYLSYDYFWLISENSPLLIKEASELQKAAIRSFNETRFINISLLGIKLGSDDIIILGNLGLIILFYWFKLCSRREHTIIAHLLKNTNNLNHGSKVVSIYLNEKLINTEISKIKWWIFNSINSNTLFINVPDTNKPFTNLDSSKETTVPVKNIFGRELKFSFLSINYLFIPIVISVLCLIMDILSVIVLPDPFNMDFKSDGADLQSGIKWVVSIIFILFIYDFSLVAKEYIKATESLLVQYFESFKTI